MRPMNQIATPDTPKRPSHRSNGLAYFELLTTLTLEMRKRFDGNRKSLIRDAA